MAKIKLGAFVADARGAVGGSVLLKGRGGNVFRTTSVKTNKVYPNGVFIRGTFAGIASRWRSLTVAQQTAWNNAAPQSPVYDVFGDVKALSGFNYFMHINSYYFSFNVTFLLLPPGIIVFPTVGSMAVVLNKTGSSFTLTPTLYGPTSGITWFVYMSYQMSPGASNASAKYRFVTSFSATGASGNIFSAYTTAYPSPSVGQRICIRMVMLSASTGRRSMPVFYSVLVT